MNTKGDFECTDDSIVMALSMFDALIYQSVPEVKNYFDFVHYESQRDSII